MSISRRTLFRNLGAAAIAGAAAPALRGLPIAAAELVLPGNAAPAPPLVSTRNGVSEPILLNLNENPYGPSEKVLAILRDYSSVGNRYPHTEYDTLIDKLAAIHRVKREQIVLGCGSSEILSMAATAFLKNGKKLVQAAPTCSSLGTLAQRVAVEVTNVPLNKRYEHDLPAMLVRAVSSGPASTGFVYIVNPNNPTGTITPRKDIEAFLAELPANIPVLIDEAYHHYVMPNASYESFLDCPVNDPRVIVSRTFSKIYGLAGMRIGYAIAAPEVVKRLAAGFPVWSVSGVSAHAASAALDDVDYVYLTVKRNTDDRQEFLNQVNARMLRTIDSQTNFLMVNPMRPPHEVVDHFKKHNILIGPEYPVLERYIRVSLGTPTEMQEFWRVWDLMPPATTMAM